MLDPRAADELPGDLDPALRGEVAHTTANAIVHGGRASEDPAVVDRLVRLVEAEGLDTVAGLWSDSPPHTLPGALWRLYALREWVRRDPRTVAVRYRLGEQRAEVHGVVAGVAAPPGPAEVAAGRGRGALRGLHGRPRGRARAGGGVLPGAGHRRVLDADLVDDEAEASG